MKNIIIAAVVGLLFMSGGFYFGLKLKPLPAPKAAPAPVAEVKQPLIPPPGSPITLELLRKTSQTMMSLNDALQAREQKVAEREARVQQREDELAAERGDLDRSHAKFKQLYAEFQSRLNLVEANQVAQLQKQADLYSAMGTTQSIELIRTMEDDEMIRLFSVMDTKPLAKLIADWKTKYPQDVPRLLHNLDGMAQVMPKEKIVLADSPPDAGPVAAPAMSPPSPDPSSPDPAAATPTPQASGETAPTGPAPTSDPASPANPAPAASSDSPATPAAPVDSSASPAPAPSESTPAPDSGSTPAPTSTN